MTIDLDIRRGPALAAALFASTALVFAPAVAAPVAHAQGCPDIEVVFARGTDEPPGLGRVGSSFVDALSGRVGGRSVGTYAVNYPATYDFLQVAAGANDASGHIQYMIANCPNTRLVLGGYSQGAAVIDVVAAVPVPGAGFTAPLPPNAPDHVTAIAVFGNPSAKIGLPLTSSPVWGSRSIDLCTPGDPVCSGGNDVPAHSNYARSGLTDQAAGFVAGLL
ncbi:cutinase family protein [Mycolicibacterium chubuense]|uniref:Cutinase n=1 Tax=Mycolicibacterium chubuense TaxID=1800 RepID=A0A0J6VY31_MYCCU|nr:cutinase family protein [Mycolicibacterium chubuense]KMO74332.1 Cutinase [Mycolicibacterium chubuense]ORA50636.1 cutinase family protein [Mycolicibacterium chubuense]SPY00149.1 Cutinase [Mycolicibacterium chubuense]